MKSVLIIGTGTFGSTLARGLSERGNQVMIIDSTEENFSDLLPVVDSGLVGDCTNEKVLEGLGVSEYDICFVCLSDKYFQACLEIVAMLKELGAKYVVAKSNKELHSKLLLKIGADEVVYPDMEIAEKCAVKYSSLDIFDFIELEDGYAIYEVSPIKAWVGKSLIQADIRKHYKVNVIAFKYNDGTLNMNPNPNEPIDESMHMLVLGHIEDLKKIEKKLD